jgi:hypothetical protein
MTDARLAQTWTVTVPTEPAARVVADRLAERGHRLVAVRMVDHFRFDPATSWYGRPGTRPQFIGWWDVCSVLVDPAAEADPAARAESTAVAELARSHGGFADGPGSWHVSTALRAFIRVGLVHELTDEEAARRRRALRNRPPAPPVVPRPAARR